MKGKSGKPITVKALHDGQVEIDGENQRRTVWLYYNDYFVLEGFNVHSSYDASNNATVVELGQSHHNIVRRVCVWDAEDSNTEIFGTHIAEHNLFEDCAGWRIARKIYQNSYGGNHTTYRRCWGRWEGSHAIGPKMTYSCFYNSHDIVLENCIGTWDARKMRKTYTLLGYDGKPAVIKGSKVYGKPLTFTDYGVDQPYGIFAADRNYHPPTKGPSLYGCIAYVLRDQRADYFFGPFFINSTQPDDGYLANCLAFRHSDARGSTLRLFSLGNCRGSSLTAVGSAKEKNYIPGFKPIVESADGRDIVTKHGHLLDTLGGASIMRRYENGKLTNKPLWPWPMNQRITDAMKLAGYDDPVDVTKTIFELASGRMPDFGEKK